jgi:hypothetical protein
MSTPLGKPSANATNLVNAPTLPNNDDKVGVFTTAQSLVTFSGATAAVTTIWKVVGQVDPRFGPTNKIVPVGLALAIGIIIFLMSVTKSAGWKSTLTGFAIAIINSFTIAAAALGIGST